MKARQPRTVIALAAALCASSGSAWAYPEFDVRGRAHMDLAFHDEDKTPLDDGVLLRRARMGIDGRIDAHWDFRIEYDFSEDDINAQEVRLRRSLPVGRFVIGHLKVPMGLNQITSSNNVSLIERSTVSNVIPDSYRMGLGYQMSEGPLVLQTLGYTRAQGEDQEGNSPFGVAARSVFNPLHSGGEMIHLGASVAYEDRGDQSTLRFRDRPEARPAGVRLIDTGDTGVDSQGDPINNTAIRDARSTLKYGLELAYQNGPFSVEAEYLSVDIDRRNNPDPTFDGFHVQASYVLTGESRGYNAGAFGGITPAGPGGAWEVAARFSEMDLSDSGVSGGKQENLTLGLNHYVNANLRFMTNLIRSDIGGGISGDETVNIALFRAAYHF